MNLKVMLAGTVLAAAATIGLTIDYAAADPIRYSVTGTDVNAFGGGVSFSLVYTSPTFITTDSIVTLDSCSIGNSLFACGTYPPPALQAEFKPSAFIQDQNNTFDQINFFYYPTDLSYFASAQLLFEQGAFGEIGTHNLTGISFSQDAVLTVTDVGVPGPLAGAGLPGLMLAGGGLFGWWRRRKKEGASALAAA